MKNKMLGTMVIILLTITVLGMVALYFLLQDDNKSKSATIEDIIEYSVDMDEITTNLKTGDFIRVQYKIQTDSKKAKEELTKRDFQVKDIIIKELSQMSPEQFRESGGIAKLEKDITTNLNELMQKGKVVKVYTTSFLLQ